MKNPNSENPRPIVNVDSGLKALEVPRLVVPSAGPSDATGSRPPNDPVRSFSEVSQECQSWHRQGISLDGLRCSEGRFDSAMNKSLQNTHSPTLESAQVQAEQFSRKGLTI
jgi:hypothetical protein